MTQRELILKALERAGAAGMTGAEIYDECGSMRYSARIEELRAEGHNIETRRDGTSRSGASIFRFVLHPTDQLFATPPTAPSSAHYLEGEAA